MYICVKIISIYNTFHCNKIKNYMLDTIKQCLNVLVETTSFFY